MAIGTATKTDDGYPILEGKDSISGLVAAFTGTSVNGHEALDTHEMGKRVSLLGPSQQGASGEYVAGAHMASKVHADNFTGQTLYLQLFDSATLPANGSAAVAEITVGLGVAQAPTPADDIFVPDWLQFSTAIYFAWSTTPGVLTVATGVANIASNLVRIYGYS